MIHVADCTLLPSFLAACGKSGRNSRNNKWTPSHRLGERKRGDATGEKSPQNLSQSNNPEGEGINPYPLLAKPSSLTQLLPNFRFADKCASYTCNN